MRADGGRLKGPLVKQLASLGEPSIEQPTMLDSGPIPHRLRRDLIARLRRIEGQAQGVQRMLADERSCSEVIHQLASIRAATRSASRALINHYVLARLHSASGDEAEELERAIADVLSVLTHAP